MAENDPPIADLKMFVLEKAIQLTKEKGVPPQDNTSFAKETKKYFDLLYAIVRDS